MRHRRLTVLATIAVALAVIPWTAASAKTFTIPEVDGAVQVTQDLGVARGHATPALAVHPDDPNTLVVAESDAYSSRCAVHVSRNGGLTWSQATQPTTPPDWQGCGFAVTGPMADLEFDAEGTLYYTWSAVQQTSYQQRIYLAKSTDLGLTWDVSPLPRVGPDPAKREYGADTMPSLVVDRDDHNRVYVAWWSNNGIWNAPGLITSSESSVWCRLTDNKALARPWAATSTDGGRTWGAPVDMAPGIGHCTTEPYLVQAKDGRLLAFFGESTRSLEEGKSPPSHLFFAETADHGKTFTVKPIYEQDGNPATPTSTSDWLGGAAPGVDLKTGNIYVAWENMGAGTPRVMFLRSTDNGRTWSQPRKVNDGDTKRDWDFPEVFPAMDVAPNGRIDIVWYDYRNDAGWKDGDRRATFQDVYYAYSTDGGQTFAKNVRINDRAIDRRFGPKLGSINGPMGVVSTDKVAFVAWDDTRNGNTITASQDIYFTRVRYAPPGEAFGGGEDTGTSPWVAGLLGAAVALAIGGLILVLGMQASRKRTPTLDKPAAAPTPTKETPVT
ncbi:MAG: exo-alpha-sialidase [Acidimicrobiales bacterium]